MKTPKPAGSEIEIGPIMGLDDGELVDPSFQSIPMRPFEETQSPNLIDLYRRGKILGNVRV